MFEPCEDFDFLFLVAIAHFWKGQHVKTSQSLASDLSHFKETVFSILKTFALNREWQKEKKKKQL